MVTNLLFAGGGACGTAGKGHHEDGCAQRMATASIAQAADRRDRLETEG